MEGPAKARAKAKVKFENAMTKLKLRIEGSASVILVTSALNQVKETWNVLDEAHTNFIVESEERKDSQENKDFAKLDSEREEIVLFTEELLVRKDSDTTPKQIGKKDVKSEQSSKSGTTPEKNEDQVPCTEEVPEQSSERGGVVAIAKDVGNKICKLLSGIRVSKTKKEAFEVQLKDQLVGRWEEDTKCKMFHGVQMAHWDTFLDLFQTTTGISQEVRATFETLPFTRGVDDSVKAFTCEGLDLKGKYGMFAMVKHPNDEVDVAYAVYSFSADFVGSQSKEKYRLMHAEQVGKTGLHQLTTPVVEDVMTGKMVKPIQRLKVDDVNSLSQNFIIAKALSAFAQNGTIPRVLYEEDNKKEIEGNGSK